MTAKIIQSIATVIVAALLLWGVLAVVHRCAPKPAPAQIQPTIKPFLIVAPATITHESVTPDSVLHEIATLDTLIATERTAVDLGIRYDETDNLFNIKANIHEQPLPKEKPVRFAMEIDSGWTGKDGYNPDVVGVAAGVQIAERYRILGYINTKKTFGIRLGVNL